MVENDSFPDATPEEFPTGDGTIGRVQRPVTAQAILDAAVRLALEDAGGGFRIDQVLIESGASSSSLYHHFGTREKLFMAVQEELYLRLALNEDRQRLDEAIATQSNDELLAYMAVQIRRIVTDPANLPVRQARLRMAAEASARPELARDLIRFQTAMFETIAPIFHSAKERGILNPELDVMAYVAWFHGMSLGRTLTEMSFTDTERWLALAIPCALTPLRWPKD